MAEIGSSLPIKTLNVPGVDGASVTVGLLDATGALVSPALEGGNLATIASDTTSIDSKVVSCDTGNVSVVSTVLAANAAQETGGNLAAIASDTASLDGKVVACDTGSVTVAASALPANAAQETGGNLAAATTSVASIDGKTPALGQTSMAASVPVAIASDQMPVPVYVTASAAEVGLAQHHTLSVATGIADTNTYAVGTGTVLKLDGVLASASGRIKVEVFIGADGAETLRATGFNSTANPNIDLPFYDYKVLDTESVKVVVTNLENQEQSVYSTIVGNIV